MSEGTEEKTLNGESVAASRTAERLAEIEARANAATPGRWEYEPGPDAVYARDQALSGPGDYWICGNFNSNGHPRNTATAAFVAHAREDVPWLVGEVRRLGAALALATRQAPAAAEEPGEYRPIPPSAEGTNYCPVCHHPVLFRTMEGTCSKPRCRRIAFAAKAREPSPDQGPLQS